MDHQIILKERMLSESFLVASLHLSFFHFPADLSMKELQVATRRYLEFRLAENAQVTQLFG